MFEDVFYSSVRSGAGGAVVITAASQSKDMQPMFVRRCEFLYVPCDKLTMTLAPDEDKQLWMDAL